MSFWTPDELQENLAEFEMDPTWFGLPPDEWSPILVDAVQELQDFYGLGVSGLVDEELFRRIMLERHFSEPSVEPPPTVPQDCILVGGVKRPIPWPHVITPDDEGGREIERHYMKGDRMRSRFNGRTVPMDQVRRVVVHWTVTRSASHTWRVAWGTRRSVSTHFEINWNGWIYQLADVAFQAYHSGIGHVNNMTIGVDLTNPVLLSYQDRLVEVNQSPRPVVEGWRINGWDPGAFLGPTQQQVDALAALAKGLQDVCQVPLVAPLYQRPDRLTSRQVKGQSASEAARLVPFGWVHHGEVLKGKWDHAGINLPGILKQAREL